MIGQRFLQVQDILIGVVPGTGFFKIAAFFDIKNPDKVSGLTSPA
jgi:hypothetical protein